MFKNYHLQVSLFTFVIPFFSNILVAQPRKYEVGSWIMATSQARIHERFGLHLEAQYRDHGLFNETEQILLRGGINFHFNNNAIFTAGYGNMSNYASDGEFLESTLSVEHRIWEQLLLKNNTGRFYLEHRYRLEQRSIIAKNSGRYLDRIRYSLRVTVPLNNKTMEAKTFFISCYNEIFIHFTNTPFDRNRLYAAAGYQFRPLANVQIGYLAQTVNLNTKHFLQAALFFNFDLRKKDS
jgi:hypothetical protein